MTSPWFDPATSGWVPAAAIGGLGLLWGLVFAALAPKGQGQPLVSWLGRLVASVSLALFLAGTMVGPATGQPGGVCLALGLPGAIGLALTQANRQLTAGAYERR